ncbi:tetratricopeptide repeat protein [Exiguobacterium acetylicum]|uniref:tetratricopeptide repeat protein n=1 Tax=Exiguobacterium acetylicum TaxID=41170 RepID=UPI0011EEACC8|nr:tetratricopeptide repeat protein [Exiguobacterium acetylicum]
MKRYSSFILLGLTIIIVLGAVGYFGYTTYTTHQTLQEKEATLKREQMVLEQAKANEQKVDVAESSFLQQKVPVTASNDDVIDAINASSQIAGVKVQSITFGQATETAPQSPVTSTPAVDGAMATESDQAETTSVAPVTANATPLPASLTVEAPSYVELMAFLKQIERTDRITVLRQIQLSGPEEPGPGSGTVLLEDEMLSFTVEIESYYRPDLTKLTPDKQTPLEEKTPKSDPFVDVTGN